MGGSLSALGVTLMGVGMVPQLAGNSSKMLTDIAIAGFILNAAGIFFGHLFAADQTMVINAMAAQQAQNVSDIEVGKKVDAGVPLPVAIATTPAPAPKTT